MVAVSWPDGPEPTQFARSNVSEYRESLPHFLGSYIHAVFRRPERRYIQCPHVRERYKAVSRVVSELDSVYNSLPGWPQMPSRVQVRCVEPFSSVRPRESDRNARPSPARFDFSIVGRVTAYHEDPNCQTDCSWQPDGGFFCSIVHGVRVSARPGGIFTQLAVSEHLLNQLITKDK